MASARTAASLTGGDQLSEILADLQRARADCDISPIAEGPTLALVGDLAGTADAFLNGVSDLFGPFKIEKPKVGTQFDCIHAIVSASVDS